MHIYQVLRRISAKKRFVIVTKKFVTKSFNIKDEMKKLGQKTMSNNLLEASLSPFYTHHAKFLKALQDGRNDRLPFC